MDAYSFVTLAIFSILTGSQALQCYDCSYNEASASNSLANSALDQINRLSNQACKLEKDGDENNVNIRQCPKPADGNVAKCAEIKGTVDTSIFTFSVQIKTVTRNCIEVDKDDSDYSNGCHHNLPSTAQNVFKNFLTVVSLGDVSFSGKACYSTDDLSAGNRSATVSYMGLVMLVVLAYTRFGLV